MILLNDFRAEPQLLREAMLASARRVIESGWYVLGNEVASFEATWAKACGVSFGVGVANGLDAIELAFRALGIGQGDEVVTTPMTAFATVLAILRAGAEPVLADIDPSTGLMSQESVARCISHKTRAVLLVHLYGQVRDMDGWQKFCMDNKITLLEDCAQAHLSELNGKVAGSFGEIGAYSFYPTKNLGAPGDAGMVVTQSEDLANRVKRLRNYGQSQRYYHPELGMNSRMDEIHAAMLATRVKWLEDFTERRRNIASAYRSGMDNFHVRLLEPPMERGAHNYHLFVVNSQDRDHLQKHLENCGIQSLIHYPVPVHYQEPCKNIRTDPLGLNNAEMHAASCLTLPCHPQMSDADVSVVVSAVNEYRPK
jgi:dTDP-4-amino-4,6-dideoxygalactose transaminase